MNETQHRLRAQPTFDLDNMVIHSLFNARPKVCGHAVFQLQCRESNQVTFVFTLLSSVLEPDTVEDW